MLVLERRINEAIIIGDGLIHVVVVSVRGCDESARVKIGIAAPKSMAVDREEVFKDKLNTEKELNNNHNH